MQKARDMKELGLMHTRLGREEIAKAIESFSREVRVRVLELQEQERKLRPKLEKRYQLRLPDLIR
jgi:hypothetical protein